MTPADFAAARTRTRLRERGAEAARLVLVDGLSEREAGRRVGVSGTTARRSRQTVERAWLEAQGLGPPLVVVTVACRPEKVQAVMEAAK